MKILWHSVPPVVPTGYGSQTKLMLRAFKALGHEVAMSCSVGMPATTLVWEGIKLFPDSGHSGKYGMDMVKIHADRWGADVVMSWLDSFVINEESASKLKWFAWSPVDSCPLMSRNIVPLKSTKWQAAPTRWGVKMLNNAGFKEALYLPCAYSPDNFYPMVSVENSKEEFGKLIKADLKGKFLVNVVSVNAGGRKNYQAVFAAWKLFHAKHPDSVLYIHADMTGYFCSGNNLIEMAKLYEIDLNSVLCVSQWEYSTGQLSEDYLNLLYNASDVHLNCCYGEGFGLPIMDAQAAGCPTVVPDFAAASEVGLCYKIKQGQFYATLPGAIQFMVDPATVAEQLELAYDDTKCGKKDRIDISRATDSWQIENVVQEHLSPILEMMERDL